MITLQKLQVRDAYHLDMTPSFITSADANFPEVIAHFSKSPTALGIFVLDEERHLLGVITHSDLLDWARAKVGALLQVRERDRERTFRLVQLMNAVTAGEVMRPDSRRAAVKPEDKLAHALRLMIELDLIVLPVVDEEFRLIDDIKLFEILARAAEENGG